MVTLHSRIPKDRIAEGTLTFTHPGLPIIGCTVIADASVTFRCRGKADNQAAADHGNPDRNPRKPFGDHPAGKYKVTLVRATVSTVYSYGPWKIDVQPFDLSGHDECADRENAEAGDDGILIHGGALDSAGKLRATFGCLRTTNEAAAFMAPLIQVALVSKEDVIYICELV